MVTVADVKIWGLEAGTVLWDADNNLASFEYNPSFIRTGLSLSPLRMPIDVTGRANRYSFPQLPPAYFGLPGLLADVLPDKFGNTLIDNWLTRQGRPTGSMNPVEKLLYSGNRGIGALEFEPANQSAPTASEKVDVAELVELVSKLLADKGTFQGVMKPDAHAMNQILLMGSSVGGARPKALIAWNPETNEVRSGQVPAPEGFNHWLLKFDGIDDGHLGATIGFGRVEMAYHNMARASGIEMTDCRLHEEGGRAHFMTRRFDRPTADEKLHFQSLHGLYHLDFNMVGAQSHSYEQVFEAMRGLNLPYPQAEQMFRRMVFNIAATNCDDHTKNIGFLMDRTGTWRLSPAYDVCYSYEHGHYWVGKQALSVNGKRENMTLSDVLTVAKAMSIKNPKEIVAEISAVVKQFPDYAAATKGPDRLFDGIQPNLKPFKL